MSGTEAYRVTFFRQPVPHTDENSTVADPNLRHRARMRLRHRYWCRRVCRRPLIGCGQTLQLLAQDRSLGLTGELEVCWS
jgi:hypothetical protein